MSEKRAESRPEISIIVPVYKVERYLNECIDSILAQTFTDFELILVDDGSPDGCPVRCGGSQGQPHPGHSQTERRGELSPQRRAGYCPRKLDRLCGFG